MRDNAHASKRLFTLESASRTLPLVRVIVADLAPLCTEMHGMQERIDYLLGDRELDDGSPYTEELSSMQDRLAKNTRAAEHYINELDQLGIRFLGAGGHVGFPAEVEGQLGYLSWKLGEAHIGHWLPLDADPADRKPLVTSVLTRRGSTPASAV